LKGLKNEIMTLFKSAPNFFMLEWKHNETSDGGRILLGNNTSGGAVMLWPVRFQCIGVPVSTALPSVCTYI
jgi:hypothetical protein